MSFTPWKTLSSKVLFTYRKWDYREDQVELPNGRKMDYQYLDQDGAVLIIPLDREGKMVVINQYRYLINDASLEFPAGLIEDGLTPLETAHKELAEETNAKAGKMEYVGQVHTAMSFSKGACHIFLASEIEPTEGQLEDAEQIEVIRMTPQEFDQKVANGSVVSGHTLAAWAMARGRVIKN